MSAIGNIYSICTYLFRNIMNITSFKRYNKYFPADPNKKMAKYKISCFPYKVK